MKNREYLRFQMQDVVKFMIQSWMDSLGYQKEKRINFWNKWKKIKSFVIDK